MSYVHYPDYYNGGGTYGVPDAFNRVHISTTTNDVASFNQVKEFTYAEVSTQVWESVVIQFNASAGDNIYIGFQYTGNYAHRWYIDEFSIVEYDPNYIPPPVISTASFGGLWSLTADDDISYANNFYYYGAATGAASTAWAFNSNATDVTALANDVTSVSYSATGEYTATFNVTGLDGEDYQVTNTRNIELPTVGLVDYVWNILPEDLYSNVYFSNYNYVTGLNQYYQRIAERFELHENTTVILDEIAFYVSYYNMNNTNRNRQCPIRIYSEDPITKLPGTLITTLNPTFANLCGTTNITNGQAQPKSYSNFTPIEITGTFYIEFDLTNLGTNGGNSNTYFAFTAAAERDFPFASTYIYFDNHFENLDDAIGGWTSSMFIVPHLTYTQVPQVPVAVVSTTPADEAIDVAIDAEVSVTFNQDIAAADLTGITINGNAVVGATVNDDKLTIPHSDFDYDTEYIVIVPANAIDGYAQAITWSFTTVEEDVVTPIEVVSTTPADNAIDVAIDANVFVTFNQAVTAADLTGITINGNAVSASIEDNNKLTISHSDFDYETPYTVVVPANAIDGYAQAITWSFTTVEEPVTPIEVVSTTPANNAIDVALNAEVSVTFNQNIAAGDIIEITINGEAANAEVDGNKLTILHSDFNYETPYTVVVTIDGYAQAITWSFTTVADDVVTPIEVVSTTPADEAIDVAIDAEVYVTFNQDIAAAADLTGITINGNAVSASIEDDKLIITHSDFDYNMQYTVVVPANTIDGYAQAITWSFTTVVGSSIPVVNGNQINIFQHNGEVNVLVSEKSEVRILDIYGRVLGNYNVNANSTLKVYQPAGIYLIEVKNNGEVSTHKVVVK